MSPEVYSFELLLIELYPFGCWGFFCPSRLFFKFGKVISNSALVSPCICCHSELAVIGRFNQHTL